MTERYRAESLKPIKRMIAAGEYHPAINALHAKRIQLLQVLENPECEDELRIGVILTCTESLLGEAYSRAGDVEQADYWFNHTFRYSSDSHDPMTRVRSRRMNAMHDCRVGRHQDALIEIDEIIDELRSAAFELGSSLPMERIKVELAFSVSCKAEIMLSQYPRVIEAFEFALDVRPILRSGTKRRYELQNLMLCIPATSRLVSPISRSRMVGRAWYLNERYAHNGATRVQLLDINTIVPVTSMSLSTLQRFTR